jgi:hypothetical protein
LASPFRLSESGFAVGEAGAPSALSVRAAEVFHELYDESFQEALADLVNEVTAEAGQMVVSETADAAARNESIERQLLEQYEPFIRAGEEMFEAAVAEIEQREGFGLSELELEEVLTSHLPTTGSPVFEGLFGGLGRLASKALSAVKNVALGPVLRTLGKAVRPLVQAAIKYGLNKAPASLRGVIRTIGAKLLRMLGEVPEAGELEERAEDTSSEAEDFDAAAPAMELEQDFRGYLTARLLAPDEVSGQALMEQFAEEVTAAAEDHLALLEDARERFVDRLANLGEGESVQPAMEEFIPVLMAVRPLLRTAINLIGRERVISTVAGLLAPIIGKIVSPPDLARQAARFLAGAGLSLIGEAEDAGGVQQAEAGGAGVPRPVGQAIAQTIEETLNELPTQEAVLRDETMLQSELLEAFERAAATAMPNELLRPGVQSAPKLRGVFQPVTRVAYLRYTRTPTVTITPPMAADIVTFGGVKLRSFLRDRYGVAPDRTVKARIHIYQLQSGGRLAAVVSSERRVPGLGPKPSGGMRGAVTKFHPLTRRAAAVLLGEPALGRDLPARYLADRHTARLGGRYYYLEVLDAAETGPVPTPRTVPVQIQGAPAASVGRRPIVTGVADHRGRASEINVTAKLVRRQLRVAIFLSEPRAQEIAGLIKRGAAPAVVLRVVTQAVREMVSTLLRTGVLNHVRIEGETVESELKLPDSVLRLIADRILPRLVDWALGRVGEYLRVRGREFVTATQDPKYGVTLLVVFRDIPLLGVLHGIVSGRGVKLGALSLPDAVPQDADVQIVAGFAS